MKQQINSSLKLALRFLLAQQKPNGKFEGYAQGAPTDTIFFTALIVQCLNRVEAPLAMRQVAASYLLDQASSTWSWNYWERNSTARQYPDDLDDTACAVAAIVGVGSDLLDAAALAHLAKNLIGCEVSPGGPYVTWLVPADQLQWRDVDPAVNANIGSMFDLLGIHSAKLEEYMDERIADRRISSPYYVHQASTLYFIARWYRGKRRDALRELILEYLESGEPTVLERAMLITAACDAGGASLIDTVHIKSLLQAQTDGHWESAPLYFEPPEHGEPRYAGSPALTTAFVMEALYVWKQRIKLPSPPRSDAKTIQEHYQQLLCQQTRPEITTIANNVAHAGGWAVAKSTLESLNLGSRNGWLAYTIYDDVLDGDADPKLLTVANVAVRESMMHFGLAVHGETFSNFVNEVLNRVDAAYYWELTNARGNTAQPEYGRYAQLAERSWGHVLAPTGVLLAAGFVLTDPEVMTLHAFFRNYLIAKQLCDDAHDWLEDLRHGHMSVVVVMVVRDCPGTDEAARQLYFWQHTIDQVNVLVRQHLAAAQQALNTPNLFKDGSRLHTWLDGLESVCQQAENKRAEAKQFIHTFTT